MASLFDFMKCVGEKYKVWNYNSAIEIISQTSPEEYDDIVEALQAFSISISDLLAPGGSESQIPKSFSSILYDKGWVEASISVDMLVKVTRRYGNRSETTPTKVEDFVGSHNLDFVKRDIACDMEWNSKDQTFDRDLFAFRSFYEYGIIKAGVIITRDDSLNAVFKDLGIKAKYGASTTWIGKLIPRLTSRRHGGCPLLILAITSKAVRDWSGNG